MKVNNLYSYNHSVKPKKVAHPLVVVCGINQKPFHLMQIRQDTRKSAK